MYVCMYAVVVVAAAAVIVVIVLLLGGSSRRWCGEAIISIVCGAAAVCEYIFASIFLKIASKW